MNVLITHPATPLGQALIEHLHGDAHLHVCLPVDGLHGCAEVELHDFLAEQRVEAVVNNYLFEGDVNAAELTAQVCYERHQLWVNKLAAACEDRLLLQLSNGYVFSGQKTNPYIAANESDALGVYGQTLWQAEQRVGRLARHLVLRTGWSFSQIKPWLQRWREGQPVQASRRHMGNPTADADTARVIAAMLKQMMVGADAFGTFHYCSAEPVSQYQWAQAVLQASASDQDGQFDQDGLLEAVDDNADTLMPLEPINGVLGCRKIQNTFGIKQRPWRPYLSEWLKSNAL